ncbi:hypothetical protein C2W62_05035 [Candidatus Entotheonella serta]|nr:hypothetical protein C2W62_05035 [Candidatus Entotheonella serta]
MFNLNTFVAECQAALETPNPSALVEALVREAVTDPDGLKAAFAATANAKSLSDRALVRSETLDGVGCDQWRGADHARARPPDVGGDRRL